MRSDTTATHKTLPPSCIRQRLGLWTTLAAMALVGACGGGGDVAEVGTGGTGSVTVGPITGLGSIFVNGVRFEDNGARALDDDGVSKVITTDDNPLRVGMVVEVTGRIDDSGSSGSATQIAYASELKGPVTAVDAGAGTFSLFGVAVRTNAATVYANFGGVAALAVGNVVELHGLRDNAGRLLATRLELKAATIAGYAAGGGEFRLRGAATGLVGSAPSQQFQLRSVPVVTDAGTRVDGSLVEGAAVSVRLFPTALGDGSYRAQRVQVRRSGFDDSASGAKGEVEGFVSGYSAAGNEFVVAGYRVRLGASVRFENGVQGDLLDGARVEAEGRVDGGVLMADKLEFKSRANGGGDDNAASSEFEFKGTAQCVVCGAAAGTFTIKGATVGYDQRTAFEGVNGSTLSGRAVEVKGLAEVTAGGTVYRATRIRLDH